MLILWYVNSFRKALSLHSRVPFYCMPCVGKCLWDRGGFRFPKTYHEIYEIYALWENGFATKWENGFLLPVQLGREVVAMGEWVRDNMGECRSTSSLSTHSYGRSQRDDMATLGQERVWNARIVKQKF
jgi:hypothetical protein